MWNRPVEACSSSGVCPGQITPSHARLASILIDFQLGFVSVANNLFEHRPVLFTGNDATDAAGCTGVTCACAALTCPIECDRCQSMKFRSTKDRHTNHSCPHTALRPQALSSKCGSSHLCLHHSANAMIIQIYMILHVSSDYVVLYAAALSRRCRIQEP